MVFENMTSEQYVRDWAMPQFYFHVVTAYSILRNAGVDLGKADYVAHMFAFDQLRKMHKARPDHGMFCAPQESK